MHRFISETYSMYINIFSQLRQCSIELQEDVDTTTTEPIPRPPRPLYIVTPTYTRATQQADLTRLANTLRLVPGVHWLVAEDANTTSEAVRDLLSASKLTYTQLAASRPAELIGKVIGRGVFNRYI